MAGLAQLKSQKTSGLLRIRQQVTADFPSFRGVKTGEPDSQSYVRGSSPSSPAAIWAANPLPAAKPSGKSGRQDIHRGVLKPMSQMFRNGEAKDIPEPQIAELL
jgi:hypothetical protein